MGLFRRSPKTGATGETRAPLVAPTLPDGPWLDESESVFRSVIQPYYGNPETMALGGHQRLAAGDDGVALFFFRKSIDMLHTAYGFADMQQRRPSPADSAILEAFCAALEGTLRSHPDAPVEESVREVVHRLRAIAFECESRGLDGDIYRSSLTRIGAAAPHVNVDDIRWA